jgi:hypothetical protein
MAHSSDVDIADLMEVICDCRKEAFPFEKYVSIMTFSTWLHWPNSQDVVSQARLVAAGSIIRAIRSNTLKTPDDDSEKVIMTIANTLLRPEAVADALVKRAMIGSYQENIDFQFSALSDVDGIVSFFLRCPVADKPSLNKALFFIEEGGYVDEESPSDKAVSATLKTSWKNFAVVAPFSFAAGFWELDELLELAPDNDSSIFEAGKLLIKINSLRRYFGTVRYVQDILLERLDPKTLIWLKFVKFPDCIKSRRTPFRPLFPDQMAILKRYHAPKQISR